MTDVNILQGSVLKVDDTHPPLRIQLIDEDGSPVDLTTLDATLLVREPYADSPKVDAQLSIKDADRGVVEYSWTSSDTDTGGIYEAEIKTTDGTDITSYPNDYYFRVHIMEDLR